VPQRFGEATAEGLAYQLVSQCLCKAGTQVRGWSYTPANLQESLDVGRISTNHRRNDEMASGTGQFNTSREQASSQNAIAIAITIATSPPPPPCHGLRI
jgi:uncharacterized protein YaiI (UPF0178 family)